MVSRQKPAIIAATTNKSMQKNTLAFKIRIRFSFSDDISKAPTGIRPITPAPVFKLDFILCATDRERTIYDGARLMRFKDETLSPLFFSNSDRVSVRAIWVRCATSFSVVKFSTLNPSEDPASLILGATSFRVANFSNDSVPSEDT